LLSELGGQCSTYFVFLLSIACRGGTSGSTIVSGGGGYDSAGTLYDFDYGFELFTNYVDDSAGRVAGGVTDFYFDPIEVRIDQSPRPTRSSKSARPQPRSSVAGTGNSGGSAVHDYPTTALGQAAFVAGAFFENIGGTIKRQVQGLASGLAQPVLNVVDVVGVLGETVIRTFGGDVRYESFGSTGRAVEQGATFDDLAVGLAHAVVVQPAKDAVGFYPLYQYLNGEISGEEYSDRQINASLLLLGARGRLAQTRLGTMTMRELGQASVQTLKRVELRPGWQTTFGSGGAPILRLKPNAPKGGSFVKPNTVRAAGGVEGNFRKNGWTYRIDTNRVQPGEGGFHVHVYQNGAEVAKITGNGKYVKTHSNATLKKPSEIPKAVRNDINRLVEHSQKKLRE
jgi:hypothetical protein